MHKDFKDVVLVSGIVYRSVLFNVEAAEEKAHVTDKQCQHLVFMGMR